MNSVEHSTFILATNATITQTDCPPERVSLVKIICPPLCVWDTLPQGSSFSDTRQQQESLFQLWQGFSCWLLTWWMEHKNCRSAANVNHEDGHGAAGSTTAQTLFLFLDVLFDGPFHVNSWIFLRISGEWIVLWWSCPAEVFTFLFSVSGMLFALKRTSRLKVWFNIICFRCWWVRERGRIGRGIL